MEQEWPASYNLGGEWPASLETRCVATKTESSLSYAAYGIWEGPSSHMVPHYRRFWKRLSYTSSPWQTPQRPVFPSRGLDGLSGAERMLNHASSIIVTLTMLQGIHGVLRTLRRQSGREGGRQAGRQTRAGEGLGVNGAPVMNVGSRIFI